MDETVRFSDTGRANVSADVGDHLTATFDHIRPTGSDQDSDDSDADGSTDGSDSADE
jgi:hypothetical protein